MRCKRRICEHRTANPSEERVVTVWVPFNGSINEHPRCNEPSDVKANKTSNTASSHAASDRIKFTPRQNREFEIRLCLLVRVEGRLNTGMAGQDSLDVPRFDLRNP